MSSSKGLQAGAVCPAPSKYLGAQMGGIYFWLHICPYRGGEHTTSLGLKQENNPNLSYLLGML